MVNSKSPSELSHSSNHTLDTRRTECELGKQVNPTVKSRVEELEKSLGFKTEPAGRGQGFQTQQSFSPNSVPVKGSVCGSRVASMIKPDASKFSQWGKGSRQTIVLRPRSNFKGLSKSNNQPHSVANDWSFPKNGVTSRQKGQLAGEDEVCTEDDDQDSIKLDSRNANSRGSKVEDTIDELISKWKHEKSLQKQFSFQLGECYKTEASRDSTLLDNEIVNVNKCLLVAELKQAIIEEKIKLICKRTSVPRVMQTSEPDVNTGYLVIRKVVLHLRDQASNNYVFCVVHHQDQVVDSQVLNTATIREKSQPSIQFTVNPLLFNNLKPNFKVVIQFFYMAMKSNGKSNKFIDFIKSLILCKKSGKQMKGSDMLAPDGNFNVTSHVNIDHGPIAESAFHRFGSITINRANCAATSFPLDRYDYMAPCKPKATLEMELLLKFDKDDEDEKTFYVHVESRFLDPDRIDKRQLEFAKFKYAKRSVEIDGKWLRVHSSNEQSLQLDLGRCLNPDYFNQPALGNLPQSNLPGAICLLFSEPIDRHTDPNSRLKLGEQLPSKHQFVFLASHKPQLLARLFGRIMARVKEARQWQEPMSSPDGIPSVVLSRTEQEGIEQQDKTAHYAKLISNIRVN